MYGEKLISGRQLKAARAIVGLSVRQMAALAGINRNSVLRVENCELLPRQAWAATRIANVLQQIGISFSLVNDQAGIHFFPRTQEIVRGAE